MNEGAVTWIVKLKISHWGGGREWALDPDCQDEQGEVSVS